MPRLYIANHNTWWDGFFLYALNQRHLRDDIHLMMGEEQFQKFRFFRKLGVFSIRTDRIGDVKAAFEYSLRVLRQSHRSSLWIFPSGEMVPYGSPVQYKDGFARIAALAQPLNVIPVATRIEYIDNQYPDVFILGGEPILCVDQRAETIFKNGTRSLRELIQRLEHRISQRNFSDFRPLLTGRSSVSDRYAKIKGAD
ncbi:MAG: hypothetical protein FJ217_00310 [Ignavibacteria bacterium]|nr:hypothetical protein [Ignavibacteria bacterium]